MKNPKLKSIYAKVEFNSKIDKAFTPLDEEYASSIRGGLRAPDDDTINFGCNSSCGKV